MDPTNLTHIGQISQPPPMVLKGPPTPPVLPKHLANQLMSIGKVSKKSNQKNTTVASEASVNTNTQHKKKLANKPLNSFQIELSRRLKGYSSVFNLAKLNKAISGMEAAGVQNNNNIDPSTLSFSERRRRIAAAVQAG
jgi:hypothetical protein